MTKVDDSVMSRTVDDVVDYVHGHRDAYIGSAGRRRVAGDARRHQSWLIQSTSMRGSRVTRLDVS